MQVVSGPLGRERVHFEAPDAARLAGRDDGLPAVVQCRQRIDPVLKAALAHLWFVTIHPFEDGNGRIARAIADMALARSENSPQRFYSMSAQIREERGRLLRLSRRRRRKAISTSPRGSAGFSIASTAHSTAPKPSWPMCCAKPISGKARGRGLQPAAAPRHQSPARRLRRQTHVLQMGEADERARRIRPAATSTILSAVAFSSRNPAVAGARAIASS